MPSARSEARRRLFRLRPGVALVCAAVLIVGAADAVTGAATAAPSAPAPLAPVLGAASSGGPVIIWLKDDHARLNLRRQAGARIAAAHADQKPVVAAIRAHRGTDIVQLVSVNAVAAHVSAEAVAALRKLGAVKEIIPDATVPVGDPETRGPQLHRAKLTPDLTDLSKTQRAKVEAVPGAAGTNPFPTVNDCGTQADPLIEPEALTTINAPAMTNAGLDTEAGHGVIVANDGISSAPHFSLVGNPNFVRPAADGGGSVVVDAEPGDTTDATDGEYYGDASSIAAQGTVEYQYANELPYSGLPDTCYFKLVGDAPGASLIDTENIDTPESAASDSDPSTLSESQIIAGIDAAVTTQHADVLNESYGYSNSPGSYAIHYAANDAAVDAGVTVVASSGDSGVSGTVSSPASDPKIIAVGATNTLRLNAMAYGFTGWVNNDVTPLSSGGPTPEGKVVDLVAPGYGGEAACNPNGSDCPTNTQTEAFGGTSESAPLVAGAAADVIQAYRDSHNGDSPSPALVKQLLTGTATDVHAPADQQGAGLLNIQAAMAAARQQPNTTVPGGTANSLIPAQTQLDVRGDGGSTSYQSVSIYNPNNLTTTVTGTYRALGAAHQLGSTVTESVSAPDLGAAVPVDGAQAAPDISFSVPAGLDRLNADLIWPDATNSSILSFTLTDPTGRLRQISYDYGSAGTATRAGTVPDIQHVEVADPEAGTWRVQVKWANGRSHLQEPPNAPGSYTGTVSFKVSGQNWVSSPASPPVQILAHRSATIPLQVSLPDAPGDHPESVQFTADDGAQTSLPVVRRTLVPSAGGEFDTSITSSVGRGIGQISTFDVNVPSGRADLGVTLTTPDTSANDAMTLFLVNPLGTSVATHVVSGRTRNGVPFAVQDVNGTPMQTVTYHVADPMAGSWEIDVELNLTTSGQEFNQTVVGDLLPQAPTITAPADNTWVTSQRPTISGTGTAGDVVTVSAGTSTACTAPVNAHGTWSCRSATLPSGSQPLTATQADRTRDPSLASAPVTIKVPVTSTVAVRLSHSRVSYGHAAGGLVSVHAATGGTATVRYGSAHITVPIGSTGTGTFTLPATLSVGRHTISAVYNGIDGVTPSGPAITTLTVTKASTSTALHLAGRSVRHGRTDRITVTVGGHASAAYPSGLLTVTVRVHGRTTKRIVTLRASAHGRASFLIVAPSRKGSGTVTVTYSGNGNFYASRASRPITVT